MALALWVLNACWDAGFGTVRQGALECGQGDADHICIQNQLILETYEERLKLWEPDLPKQVWIVDRELRGIDRGLNEDLNDLLIAGAALRMEMARESTAQDRATSRFLVIGAGATTMLLLFMLGMAVRRG